MNTLISLLIFSLPLGVILRVKLFQNVFIYPTDIIVGTIFVISICKFIVSNKKVPDTILFKLLAAFLATGLFSLIINSGNLTVEQFWISFAYAFRFAAYINIFFAVQPPFSRERNQIQNKLLLSGAIFIFFGFMQYFFYKDLRNITYLGWDQHLYRLVSSFLDPNFTGAFLVLILILVTGKVIGLMNSKLKDVKKIIIYFLYSAITLISIILTYSRSAIVMLFVGMTVLLLLNKMYKQLIVGLVVVVGLIFIFSNFKIEGLNPLRTASSEARVRSATEAIAIIIKNPILGVGFNSYRYAQVRYGARSALGISLSNADSVTDNSFLFVTATTGIVGLAIFLKLLYELGKCLLVQTSKKINKNNWWIGQVAFASFISVLVNSIFISSFFYVFILAWLMLITGVAIQKNYTK